MAFSSCAKRVWRKTSRVGALLVVGSALACTSFDNVLSSKGSVSDGAALDGADSEGPPSCTALPGAAVTLDQTDSGLVLSNGLVTVTIASSGEVTQVAKGGTNLMAAGQTMYVSESGGATYYEIHASSHSVVQETPEFVEVSFADDSAAPHDMDWDLHFAMRRGVSGFYYFLLAQVGTATHPNPVTLSELRTVQRFDPSVLVNGYNGERHGLLPTPAQITTPGSEGTTYVLPDSGVLPGVSSLSGVVGQDYDEGPIYTEYDWVSYRAEDLLHGVYGNGFGAWMLSPSWEFYTGGPVKQELMVEEGTLVLNMYHGTHAGSAIDTPSPADWQKLYGPNLVYFNTGTDAAVIADAEAQAATERNQWPYCWMKSPVYPLAEERGTVTGTLSEAHGQSVAYAMVTLAAAGPLLTQGYNYMFWAEADANGDFSIPAVRPNTYSVHVYATQGTIVDDPDHGEIVGTITVQPGVNDLGTLVWSPPYHANLLWSIGESDQRSGEFRVSSSAAPGAGNTAYETGRSFGPSENAGVWTLPPASATYTIGTSTPQTDWYFAQSVDGSWAVDFDLASVPAGGATLTIALAGAAKNPQLTAFVNGQNILGTSLGNDESLYRSCLEGGLFQLLTAPVPAAGLRVGSNTATFTVNTQGTAGAGIYYDILKLESD